MIHSRHDVGEAQRPEGGVRHGRPLKPRLRDLVRRLFQLLGFEVVRRRPGVDLMHALTEFEDDRAFRAAAESEIRLLKERAELLDDQVRVERELLSSLRFSILGPAGEASSPATGYPSCPWIEGGLSFIPGRLRVCPNSHVGGGTPGLRPFSDGPLPVADILERREIMRHANRMGQFQRCKGCAFLTQRNWGPRSYAFDLLCIAHATACNLACSYCHSIPEERYLQNPGLVPHLYPTIEALIGDGHLAPDARIQWGGGEPTILREFEALFGLLSRHGADSEVYTSGVRIPPVLLDGLRQGRAGVMISLDAGTPETYARIKGKALFDRAVANVARYAEANPGRTILKMILSEANLKEVSEFLDIAERSGVRIVCHDTMMYQERVDERVLDASARFQMEAARRGLECRIGEVGSVFNPAERVAERIEEIRTAL